jgi:hypothetical protein
MSAMDIDIRTFGELKVLKVKGRIKLGARVDRLRNTFR